MKLWNNINYRTAHQYVGAGSFSGRVTTGFKKRAELMRQLLKLKPGDVVHDCSGFNHIVGKTEISFGTTSGRYYDIIAELKTLYPPAKMPWFIDEVYVYCECHGNNLCHPEWPVSVENIIEWVKGWDCSDGWDTINKWEMNDIKKCVEALRENKVICDSNGCILPEYDKERDK